MELFDLFFWTIGRGIQKVCAVTGVAKFNLSDGGRWSLGFFSTVATCLLVFMSLTPFVVAVCLIEPIRSLVAIVFLFCDEF